jgi:hypothetical protein
MLAFKFPLGLHERGLGLHVLAAGVLEAVAANRPRHRRQAAGSKCDDDNGRHHRNCADHVRGFSIVATPLLFKPQTEDCRDPATAVLMFGRYSSSGAKMLYALDHPGMCSRKQPRSAGDKPQSEASRRARAMEPAFHEIPGG